MKKIRMNYIYGNTNRTFLELEKLVEENVLENMNALELLSEFSIEEIIYLKDAITMPKDKFMEIINMIDTTSGFNADTVVYEISRQYGVTKEDVIRRIREVRVYRREKNGVKKLKRGKKGLK